MILSLYAGMMRAGIPMSEADKTDLGMYLRVIGHAAKQQADRPESADAGRGSGGSSKDVILLKRGTIDEFM